VSRAFVKEPDGDAPEALPERPISPHPNLVTPQGLAAIKREITRLDFATSAAVRADDKAALAAIQRDLRYWNARRASAQLIGPPTDSSRVQFGSTVTFARDDGRRQTFRIVGEDEADPTQGTISHVSPVARALLGNSVGDVVTAGGGEVEILEIK
jgi:transcription elongation GreA/GreB family factor